MYSFIIFLKCVILIPLLLSCVSAKSFTVVLDTTFSMKEEIKTLRTELRSALYSFSSNNTENYILVPFNDPEVASPRVYSYPEGLISDISSITSMDGEGHECPENSVTAIQEALQSSRPESLIFVFTDAYANDANKFDNIENLCRHTRSQVNIFLSGYCVPTESSEEGSVQVYYDIAKACSGTVFRMDPLTSEVFKFIKEMVQVDEWAEIVNYGYQPSIKLKVFKFSVDDLTNEVIIVANGKHPNVDVHDKNGRSPASTKIMDNNNAVVIKIITEQAAEYRVRISCRGSVTATLYRKTDLPFSFGFSTKLPHSLKETGSRPMPDVTNYIFIQMKTTSFKVIGIELQIIGTTKVDALRTGVMDSDNGRYIAETLIEKDKSFKMIISVEEVTEGKSYNITTRTIKPQQNGEVYPPRTKPVLEIITSNDTLVVNYNSTVTIPCKVTGYPIPDIKWEDEKSWSIATEEIVLEIPNVFISYATINNIDQNRTLFCKAKNSEGETSNKIQLNVFRPYSFDVIQAPTNSTFEYGAEGRLDCEINAYPEALIKWYHNDTILEADYVFESNFVIDNKGLTIKNMTLDDVGLFKCVAYNDIKNMEFTAAVTISGVEAPELEISEELILSPGDWKDIECKITKGKPKPNVIWKYKPEADHYGDEDFPDGIVTNAAKLKIGSAKIEHNGIYICEGENIVGSDRKEMIVKVQYAPKISINQLDSIELMEEDTVSIDCQVDAVPEANVKWEMHQKDKIVPFDDRKTVDANHSLRFTALWNDSGSYHCVAENSLGKTEKVVEVNVLVRPYIQPQPDMICLKGGESVGLDCNIMYGNPAPSVKWEFIALNSTSTILSRGNSSSTLHLNNVSKGNEGTYICTVENSVGYDTIQIIIKVK